MDVALRGFVFHSCELLRKPNVSLDPSFRQVLLETANDAAMLQFCAFIYADLRPEAVDRVPCFISWVIWYMLLSSL